MATKPYHRWPPPLKSPDGPLRLAIYARTGNQCALKLKGCTLTPTQLDHITHPNQGGQWFDPHNLRGVCGHCNNKRPKPNHRKSDMGHITIVTGPSGAGKTTYVRTRKQPGDTVIDFDELARALGSTATTRDPTGRYNHPPHIRWVAYAAWTAALNKATTQRKHRAWLIHAQPRAATLTTYRQRGATIITINPDTHQPTTTHKPAPADPKPTKPSRQW